MRAARGCRCARQLTERSCRVLLQPLPTTASAAPRSTACPPPAEAALMFADPSKMQNMDGVPLPAHWYKAPVQIM